MKVAIPILLLTLCSCLPFPGCSLLKSGGLLKPTDSAYPVLVAIEMNPWIWHEGSGCPEFALYSDGSVIYRERSIGTFHYYKAVLPQSDVESILERYVRHGRLDTLANTYYTISGRDVEHNWIIFQNDSGLYQSVYVYGDLTMETLDIDGMSQWGKVCRSRTPQPFLDVLDFGKTFQHTSSETWMPDSIEILFLRRGRAATNDTSQNWPSAWSVFESDTAARTIKIKRLVLPVSMKDSVESFRVNLTGPVRIGGQMWDLALIRYIFPREEIWAESVNIIP